MNQSQKSALSSVLELASGLAPGYRDLGRYQEAAELVEATLRIKERVLGPEHPDTLTSRNNLAANYRGLGWRQGAAELVEDYLKKDPF
jgi:hypothetical protein